MASFGLGFGCGRVPAFACVLEGGKPSETLKKERLSTYVGFVDDGTVADGIIGLSGLITVPDGVFSPATALEAAFDKVGLEHVGHYPRAIQRSVCDASMVVLLPQYTLHSLSDPQINRLQMQLGYATQG
jgi:hypothetical protein